MLINSTVVATIGKTLEISNANLTFLEKESHLIHFKKSLSFFLPYLIRHGLGVRIAGSHPAGPGSIPGAGTFNFFHVILVERLFGVFYTMC